MVDPVTILLALKITAALVSLALVTYRFLITWFQAREQLMVRDRDNIAVTVRELFETNNYKLVQGVFNTRTNTVVDGRIIHARGLDQDVYKLHREKQLVIYQ